MEEKMKILMDIKRQCCLLKRKAYRDNPDFVEMAMIESEKFTIKSRRVLNFEGTSGKCCK